MIDFLGGILAISLILGILYLAFIYKPNSQIEEKNDSDTDRKLISREFFISVQQQAAGAMDYVASYYDDFSLEREKNYDYFLSHFCWFVTAVYITKGIKEGVNPLAFAMRIYETGQRVSEHEKNNIYHFTQVPWELFQGYLNVYLGAFEKYMSNELYRGIDPGPGFLLITNLMKTAKGLEELSDDDLSKCMNIGEGLSSSMLNVIARPIQL